jgi:hypothetical protein
MGRIIVEKTVQAMPNPFLYPKPLLVILPVLLLGATVSPVEASIVTVGPSDCSAATVNAAISASSTHDGDTVMLTCTGSITWTATVSIPSTKGITLQASGGRNTPKGAATFPLVITSNQPPAIEMSVGTNHAPARVSGFRFAPNTGTADPFLLIGGQGTGTSGIGGFRLDNNYLDSISGAEIMAVWASQGNLFGLIDNNTFHNLRQPD